MPASEFALLLEHSKSLLREERWDAAYLHAKRALDKAQYGAQAGQLLQACQHIPAERRLGAPWAPLLALMAFRANDPTTCEMYVRACPDGQGALRAWLLMLREDFGEALTESENALTGELAGIAWRMRAWAMVRLKKPGWEEAYREATRHNDGRQRGFCLLQLGAYLSYAGNESGARSAYAEAVPLFAHDPELRANAAYNVGTACLRLQQLGDAERAYQEAMTAARKPAGVRMLARAWSGLGHVYRARAEFARALHAYDTAQTKATDLDDVAQAWRGKAHTLRLLGRLDQALATLFEGLERLGFPAVHGLYADMAATQVMLGDAAGARRSLDCLPEGQAEEAQRAQVVRAELARRQGDLRGAARLLEGLNRDALWTNEEARLLPELFALIGVHVPPVPPVRLQVHADGPVRALLNNLALPLPSSTPSASLLALLVWHGGRISVKEAVTKVMLPGETSRLKQQNLSRALATLRDVLGWPGAVQTNRGIISLDPSLHCEALGLPAHTEDFCAGLDDPWVTDWREEHDELNRLLKFE